MHRKQIPPPVRREQPAPLVAQGPGLAPSGAWQRLAQDEHTEPPPAAGLHSFSNMSVFPPSRSEPGSIRGDGPEVVARGLRGSGSPLPHLQQLQESFGPYDLSSLQLHRGEGARDAADALSARAFTHGEHIVAPQDLSLRDTAHEVAHAIQQRQPGLVPERISAPSDAGERHADAVADRVVQGRSAVDLLSAVAPLGLHAPATAPPGALQRRVDSKTAAQRIAAAIRTLDNYVQQPGKQGLQAPWRLAKQSLQSWQESADRTDEVARVGVAMHLGRAGTAEERELRRAIILLRTALLRNETEQAHTEVVALDTDALDGVLTAVLDQAGNPVSWKTMHYTEREFYGRWHDAWLEERTKADPIDKVRQTANSAFWNKRKKQGALSSDEDQQRKDMINEAVSKHPELTAARQQKLDVMDQRNQELENFRQERRQKPRVIFQPSKEDDGPIRGNIEHLRFPVVNAHSHKRELTQLAAGGELFVVGHGNFGLGVGTHSDHVDAEALLNQLVEAGLPKTPTAPVELFIWACWGAVRTQEWNPADGFRQPYAQRLASQMASRGFTNYNIIGFAGSMVQGDVYQQVIEEQGDEKNNEPVDPAVFHSVYAVRSGRYDRTYGEDWEATISRPAPEKEIYQVRRRGRR